MSCQVYISYTIDDKATADAVCNLVERRKIRCWIAPRDILPGENWAEAIPKAISACDALVVILSGEANKSSHVLREVELAVSAGKYVIPIRIEDVEPSQGIQYLIQTAHWLDALTPPLERHIERLADSLEALLCRDEKTSPPSDGQSLKGDRRTGVGATSEPVTDHPPHSDQLDRQKLAFSIFAGLVMIGLVAFAATTVFDVFLPGERNEVAEPLPSSPAPLLEKQIQVGGNLIYRWKDETRNRQNLTYEITRTLVSTGKSFPNEKNIDATSWRENRAFQEKVLGNVVWQVRARWENDLGEIERSDWSAPATIEYYQDTLARILDKGTVQVISSSNIQSREARSVELRFLDEALSAYVNEHSTKPFRLVRNRRTQGTELFESLAFDQFDVIVGQTSATPERENKYNIVFTNPLYTDIQAIVHLRNESVCFDNQICRILFSESSTSAASATRLQQKFDSVSLRPVKSMQGIYNEITNKLIRREADLAIMDRNIALRFADGDEFGIRNLDSSILSDPPCERISIATKRFDSRLRKVLNDAISERKPDLAKEGTSCEGAAG